MTPSSPPLNFSDHTQKLDIESVQNLVFTITNTMQSILQHHHLLKQRTFSKLKIHPHEFFDFSDHSVLSNLYWGIHTILNFTNERQIKIDECERVLQVPASLDENGTTLGVPNCYIVCCSYFYLSILEFLRGNEWQCAVHFLQAVCVSPEIVCTEFAPGVWQSFYPLFLRQSGEESEPLDDERVDGVMRWVAKRYKPWLMYYQIMSTSDSCAM